MKTQIQAGPYKTITSGAVKIPLYLIPFDENGVCQAPETVEELKEAVKTASDLYVFSHGWNNDFDAATKLYEHFIGGYMSMREKNKLPSDAGYKPVLVGVIWPSAILVREDEQPPKFLSLKTDWDDDVARDKARSLVSGLAGKLKPEELEFLLECIEKKELSEKEGGRFAELLAKTYDPQEDEVTGETLTAKNILATWSTMEKALTEDPFADMWTQGVNPKPAGAVADLLQKFTVKNVLRTFTVWQMKDRAGVVGKVGVHKLLVDLMTGTKCKVHLIGHSYGTKVLMSAVCAGALPRKVRSALLLQGAISHLCFADNVNNTGKPGGFQKALDRIELPILSTYSEHDFPLTQVFHLALRRSNDMGEVLAINLEKPPSIFAALGGFGPRSVGGTKETTQRRIAIKDLNDNYELDKSVRIYGLDGSRKISGHGDISNEATWWALYNLVSSKN